jgi:hypothetical protein
MAAANTATNPIRGMRDITENLATMSKLNLTLLNLPYERMKRF